MTENESPYLVKNPVENQPGHPGFDGDPESRDIYAFHLEDFLALIGAPSDQVFAASLPGTAMIHFSWAVILGEDGEWLRIGVCRANHVIDQAMTGDDGG